MANTRTIVVANRAYSTIGFVSVRHSPLRTYPFLLYRESLSFTVHAFAIGGVPDAVLIGLLASGPFNLF